MFSSYGAAHTAGWQMSHTPASQISCSEARTAHGYFGRRRERSNPIHMPRTSGRITVCACELLECDLTIVSYVLAS